MKTTDLYPNSVGTHTISILRRIARERAKYAAIENQQELTNGAIAFEDARYLSKFISESAFYIEELERTIGEELVDYWQTREHALRILTSVMMQQPQTNA